MLVQVFFNVKTQKAFHFNALIEKEFIYKSEGGPTPRHTTQPKEVSLREKMANAPSPCFCPDHTSALIVSSREATEGCVVMLLDVGLSCLGPLCLGF
jgi:hypothetical protein